MSRLTIPNWTRVARIGIPRPLRRASHEKARKSSPSRPSRAVDPHHRAHRRDQSERDEYRHHLPAGVRRKCAHRRSTRPVVSQSFPPLAWSAKDCVYPEINRSDQQCAEPERKGNRARRTPHFTHDVSGGVPSRVSIHHPVKADREGRADEERPVPFTGRNEMAVSLYLIPGGDDRKISATFKMVKHFENRSPGANPKATRGS